MTSSYRLRLEIFDENDHMIYLYGTPYDISSNIFFFRSNSKQIYLSKHLFMVFSLIKLFDRKIVFWFVDLKNSWYYFYRQKQKSDKRLFLKSNIQIFFRQMVNRFMIFFSSVVIMSLISDSILSKCLFDIRIYEHVSFKWLIFSVFLLCG